MALLRIRLHFKAPLHIAARGVGFEKVSWLLHSDTLYSAIFSVWHQIDSMAAQKWLHADDPPFVLSSAFPFLAEEDFYPRPRWPLRAISADDRKKFSRVQFISEAVFRSIIAGQDVTFRAEETSHEGHFWHAQKPNPGKKELIKEVEVPRVMVDRVSNETQLYYVSELHFSSGTGLYFWVRLRNPEIKDAFLQVLRLLGDEGIGLDRTCGRGHFCCKTDDNPADLPSAKIGKRFLSLSLYYPTAKEMAAQDLQLSGYELIQRGGYISGRSYRRKTLNMFAEGSVFGNLAGNILGRKGETLDEDFIKGVGHHQVFRYGYAFAVGFYDEESS